VETQDYAPTRLRTEVIEEGLCPICGGCVAGCPYLGTYSGRVIQLDKCTVQEGSCYAYCPRTFTDLDKVSRNVFGEAFGTNDLGTFRATYLARARDAGLRESSGGGGVVPALLAASLEAGVIDAVVTTTTSPDDDEGLLDRNVISAITLEGTPSATVTSDPAKAAKLSTAAHRFSRVLAGFNSLRKDSAAKVGMTCLPCQVTSLRKRIGTEQPNRVSVDSIGLLVSEFCAAKRWLEPGEDRQKANKACSFCWDYTGEFADVSVGSGRAAHKGWDAVIVRTEAGEKAFDAAVKSGAIEVQPLPRENVDAEMKASRDKKKRALRNITEKTGNEIDLMYLEMPRTLVDTLLKEER
jgi:coenzyme F420 hydrogenase subunit beta